MTRYLSLKAALLEPRTLELMMDFLLSTSYWLVQLATENPRNVSIGDEVDAAEGRKRHEVSFPLSDDVSPVLLCIPELIANNIIDFLLCLRRYVSCVTIIAYKCMFST